MLAFIKDSGIPGPLLVDNYTSRFDIAECTAEIFDSIGMAIDDTVRLQSEVFQGCKESASSQKKGATELVAPFRYSRS